MKKDTWFLVANSIGTGFLWLVIIPNDITRRCFVLSFVSLALGYVGALIVVFCSRGNYD